MIGVELTTHAIGTFTSGWSTLGEDGTTGGGSAGNMGVSGEFIIANGGTSDPTLDDTVADNGSFYAAIDEIDILLKKGAIIMIQ